MTLFRQSIANPSMEENPAHESWQHWFQHHGPKLLLWARQCTRSLADAEDVLQEAIVRYWRHQRQLGGDPRPLLFTSIRRAAVDLARRNARRLNREQRCAADADVSWFVPEAGAEEHTAQLEAAVRRLPDEQREVLVLKLWGELTFEEIARQAGIPPNTAASRYRYALAALRKELTTPDRDG